MKTLAAVNALASLAQETRLLIFRLLVQHGPEGLPAGTIAETLRVPNATLSFHLSQLTRGGLLESRRRGRSITYAVNIPGVRDLLAFLMEDCCQGRKDLCGTFPDTVACCPPASAVPPSPAEADGRMTKPKILFLCTGNSCRSQMAEGWARHLKGDALEPYSAGIETHGLNPRAVQVMAEAGVDISSHHSKTLGDLKDVPFDYVVTVCAHAHETCPVFPGKAMIVHVGFDDPPRLASGATTEEEALQHYRRVRDEIRAFIVTLPESLTKDP